LSDVKHIEGHSDIKEMERMNQFAKAAIKAVKFYRENTEASLREMWQQAIDELSCSDNVREKTCPRNTFLGLCSDGFINGIPAKEYTDSVERCYARKAVEILRKNPSLADSPCRLWSEIGNDGKSSDSQMEIVIALWKEGEIMGHVQKRA
jgi:serine/threonine protein phosphatase PrpC